MRSHGSAILVGALAQDLRLARRHPHGLAVRKRCVAACPVTIIAVVQSLGCAFLLSRMTPSSSISLRA
jgi:hypothetical protein